MLGKLMKYEWKATVRFFAPIYLAILVLSILNRFLISHSSFSEIQQIPIVYSLIQFLLPSMLALAIGALILMTLIVLINRYNQNLLSNEGYLMFTLPVKKSDLVLSKYLNSLLWIFLSIVLFFLTAMIIGGSDFINGLQDLWSTIRLFFQEREYLIFVYGITILMMSIASMSNFIFQVYSSLTIAQSHKITKNRVLGGVIIFIIIKVVLNAISTFTVLALSKIPDLNQIIEDIFFANRDIPGINFLLLMLFLLIIQALIFYFINHYFLSKKLNLD